MLSISARATAFTVRAIAAYTGRSPVKDSQDLPTFARLPRTTGFFTSVRKALVHFVRRTVDATGIDWSTLPFFDLSRSQEAINVST